MNLYEIQTSWTGESYVRAYAWAETESEARELFEEKHRGTKYENAVDKIVLLIAHDAKPFCTQASDSGWTPDSEPRAGNFQ